MVVVMVYLVSNKSCLTLANPWTVPCQAPLSLGFPRQEYWSGLPFLSPGDLPNPGIELVSPALAGGFSYCWVTWEAPYRGWFWVVKLKSLFKMISILLDFRTHHQSFHFMTYQFKSLIESIIRSFIKGYMGGVLSACWQIGVFVALPQVATQLNAIQFQPHSFAFRKHCFIVIGIWCGRESKACEKSDFLNLLVSGSFSFFKKENRLWPDFFPS